MFCYSRPNGLRQDKEPCPACQVIVRLEWAKQNSSWKGRELHRSEWQQQEFRLCSACRVFSLWSARGHLRTALQHRYINLILLMRKPRLKTKNDLHKVTQRKGHATTWTQVCVTQPPSEDAIYEVVSLARP